MVTRLDHDANVRPWVYRGRAAGATLRWADFDPDTGELTRGVAARFRRAHPPGGGDRSLEPHRHPARPGAGRRPGPRGRGVLYVDGVHLTAHAPSTSPRSARTSSAARRTSSSGRTAVCSPRGPTCSSSAPGQAAARLPTTCRSASSSARCHTSCWRGRPPRSTSSPAWPVPGRGGSGWWRSMAAVEEHEDRLRERIEGHSSCCPGCTLFAGGPPHADAADDVRRSRREDGLPIPGRRGMNAPAGRFTPRGVAVPGLGARAACGSGWRLITTTTTSTGC